MYSCVVRRGEVGGEGTEGDGGAERGWHGGVCDLSECLLVLEYKSFERGK